MEKRKTDPKKMFFLCCTGLFCIFGIYAMYYIGISAYPIHSNYEDIIPVFEVTGDSYDVDVDYYGYQLTYFDYFRIIFGILYAISLAFVVFTAIIYYYSNNRKLLHAGNLFSCAVMLACYIVITVSINFGYGLACLTILLYLVILYGVGIYKFPSTAKRNIVSFVSGLSACAFLFISANFNHWVMGRLIESAIAVAVSAIIIFNSCFAKQNALGNNCAVAILALLTLVYFVIEISGVIKHEPYVDFAAIGFMSFVSAYFAAYAVRYFGNRKKSVASRAEMNMNSKSEINEELRMLVTLYENNCISETEFESRIKNVGGNDKNV